MKRINLTNLVKLHKAQHNAETYASTLRDSYKAHPDNVYYKTRYDRARQEADQAAAAYQAACDALTEAIKAAEGRATARTITADNVASDVKAIIDRLNITKKAIAGTVAYINHNAQAFPSAYRYVPEATIVTVEFDRTGTPYVVDIKRDRCGKDRYSIRLSDTAKQAVLARAACLWS